MSACYSVDTKSKMYAGKSAFDLNALQEQSIFTADVFFFFCQSLSVCEKHIKVRKTPEKSCMSGVTSRPVAADVSRVLLIG